MVRQRKKAQRAGGAHSTPAAAQDLAPRDDSDPAISSGHDAHDAHDAPQPVPLGGQATVGAATEMQASLCTSLPCHTIAVNDLTGLAKAVRAVQSARALVSASSPKRPNM